MLALAGYALSQLSGALKDRKKAHTPRTSGGDCDAVAEPVHLGRPVLLAVLEVQALSRRPRI